MAHEQPPPVTTLEGVGVLLWAMQRQADDLHHALKAQSDRLAVMATHEDIRSLRQEIAALAKSDDVDARFAAITRDMDAKLGSLRDDLQRNRPATLGKQVVAWFAGVAVVLSCVGLLVQIAVRLDRIATEPVQAVPK